MSTPFVRGPSGPSRPFEAKFPGICETCGDGFEQGDTVMYEDDALVHADLDDCVSHQRYSSQKPCPKCFLVHAGECF